MLKKIEGLKDRRNSPSKYDRSSDDSDLSGLDEVDEGNNDRQGTDGQDRGNFSFFKAMRNRVRASDKEDPRKDVRQESDLDDRGNRDMGIKNDRNGPSVFRDAVNGVVKKNRSLSPYRKREEGGVGRNDRQSNQFSVRDIVTREVQRNRKAESNHGGVNWRNFLIIYNGWSMQHEDEERLEQELKQRGETEKEVKELQDAKRDAGKLEIMKGEVKKLGPLKKEVERLEEMMREIEIIENKQRQLVDASGRIEMLKKLIKIFETRKKTVDEGKLYIENMTKEFMSIISKKDLEVLMEDSLEIIPDTKKADMFVQFLRENLPQNIKSGVLKTQSKKELINSLIESMNDRVSYMEDRLV